MNVFSSQIFTHVTRTNIPYAYSVKLLNLEMKSEPVLAQDDLLPFVANEIPKAVVNYTQDNVISLRQSTNDHLLYTVLTSYTQSRSISSKLQRLNNESKTNIFCNVELKANEYEILSFVFGPEVIKVNDIVRVKVKPQNTTEFAMLHFRIRAIILDKDLGQLFIHGEKLGMQRCAVGAVGSFVDNNETKNWVSMNQQLFQIKTDRLLGRFYTHYPRFGMDKLIDIAVERV